MAKRNREKMFMVLTVALLLAVSIQGVLLGKILWYHPETDEQITFTPKSALDTYPHVAPSSFGSARDRNTWNPFAEMDRMRQEIHRVFNHSFDPLQGFSDFYSFGSLPIATGLDLSDAGNQYEVRLNLPDIQLQDINVKVKNQTLIISGISREEVEKKGSNMRHQERRAEQFTRTVQLPGPVQPGKMDVTYEKGVLLITLPKEND
ncbi:MAG TPA: Hsp20/alpha crystallin family protein [Pontiella sp.]